MVDLLALVISVGMLAVVIFFAMRLDKSRPWFERPQARAKTPPPQPQQATAARQPARSARFLGRR